MVGSCTNGWGQDGQTICRHSPGERRGGQRWCGCCARSGRRGRLCRWGRWQPSLCVCVRSEEASEGQTCGGLRDCRRRVRIELILQNARRMASASLCRPADCSGLTAQSAPSSLLFRGSCLLRQLPTTGCGPLCDAYSANDYAIAVNERAGARRVLRCWCKGQKGGGSGGRPCRQQPFQS